MATGLGNSMRRHLPVIDPRATPPSSSPSTSPDGTPTINENCTLVRRLGQPVYESCRFCTLRLGSCLQFQGQLATIGLLLVFFVAALVPIPYAARVGLLVTGALGLVLYLRHVAQESHRSIVLNYELRNKQRELEATMGRLADSNRDLSASMQQLQTTQEKLVEAGKMAAVGTLAAGVAHEINNPLGYMVSNLEFALTELQECTGLAGTGTEGATDAERLAELRTALEEARQGAERVRDIVRDLKVVARADDTRTSPIEVLPVLELACKMAANEIRPRARLVRDFDKALPLVRANDHRLGQVVLNLLINAAQAIPPDRPNDNEIRVSVKADARRHVIVAVEDTGSGIAAEHLPRIFEPFFTTKPVGQGTGLGLAICHGIISALGGQLSVQSEVGKGSRFEVDLPPADDAA